MGSLVLTLAVKGTAVLALGACAAFLLRRASAALRHCVWVATFVALLAVPALDALGPSWHVEVLPEAVAPASVAAFTVPAAAAAEPYHDHPEAPHTVSLTGGSIDLATTVATWLAWLWALGTFGVGLWWVRGLAVGHRLVGASRDVDGPIWSTRLRTAARASGLKRPVRLCRSEALRVPVAWGWGRQAIVLPPQSDAWDTERAHAVLLHEMAHLRRRDAWTQGLAQAALAFHWPNPIAWIAYRRFLDAREQACDDAVLQVGATPTTYASHLVAIARELCPTRPTLASVTPMIGPDELETRVLSILDSHRRRERVGRWTMSVTLVIAIGLGGPLAAFQPVASLNGPGAHPTVGVDDEGREITAATVDPIDPGTAEAGVPDAEPAAASPPETVRETAQQTGPSARRDTIPVRDADVRAPENVPEPESTVGQAHGARWDTDGELRNAVIELRNTVTESRNTETELQNDATELRNTRTELQNDAMELQNTLTELQNTETELRSALGRQPAARPRAAAPPPGS